MRKKVVLTPLQWQFVLFAIMDKMEGIKEGEMLAAYKEICNAILTQLRWTWSRVELLRTQ